MSSFSKCNESLSQIEASDGFTFFCHFRSERTSEKRMSADLTLVKGDGRRGWSARLDENFFENGAKCTKTYGVAEYIEETVQALTGLRKKEYVYQINVDGALPEFTWKIQRCPEVLFKLGSVKLAETDVLTAMLSLLKFSVSHMAGQQMSLDECRANEVRMASERDEAMLKLDKFVKLKEEEETALFSKFNILINEQKAKNRKLRQERGGEPPTKRLAAAASDDEDDYGSDTDVDSAPSQGPSAACNKSTGLAPLNDSQDCHDSGFLDLPSLPVRRSRAKREDDAVVFRGRQRSPVKRSISRKDTGNDSQIDSEVLMQDLN